MQIQHCMTPLGVTVHIIHGLHTAALVAQGLPFDLSSIFSAMASFLGELVPPVSI
jgi:hypothetical protein